MVFTREKHDMSNTNREQCFFHVWEKWYVKSEDTEVCEFHAKIRAFYRRLPERAAALRRHIQREKFFSKSSFRKKKWKNISEIGVE